ncbi:MAG: threonine/serine exporter family protein [Clostridia bacterium]|nr:threonine/serine exporter family protein [Clostridia bacterium]
MTLTKAEEYKLLHLLLDMGEMMMCSGGEVRRVENTLSLMGKAYGATETDVMVITASIIVTMKFGDGNLITESRRVESPGSNKLWRLEGLNALSRKCCESPLPIEELELEIKSCKQPANLWKFYLGSALAAGAFAVFFGGNILDGIIAAVFALLVCFFQRKISNIFPNNIIFNIVCSFVVGVLICMATRFIPTTHTDMVIIGVIMLLIPGIAFTNSMRDILVGDTISGLMRLIESLLWAAGLAVGFMLAILLVGGIAI